MGYTKPGYLSIATGFFLILSACPQDPIESPTDQGHSQVDAGHSDAQAIDSMNETDAGQVETDAGQIETDAGQVETDAGQVETDAGQVETDAGQVETDAGQVETDAGQVETDAGQVETDAGQVETDAGQVETDAGQVETDAASTDAFVNTPPIANAGDDQIGVARNSTVTLDGSASHDEDGHSLTYLWTQSSGPSVTLSDDSAINPSFTAPGDYAEIEFSLVVNDGWDNSAPDKVRISTANSAPSVSINVDANPVPRGTSVSLYAIGNDPDGDSLVYAWQQISGTAVTLSSDSSDSPSFTSPLTTGDLLFSLTVSDGVLASDPAEFTVTVYNTAPVAALDQEHIQVERGATVNLDGSASGDDDPNDNLSFFWRQTSGPSVTINDPDTAVALFSAPSTLSAELLIFELTVSDGLESDSATIQVDLENTAPSVQAQSSPCTCNKGQPVSLSGAASDPDGDSMTYAWAQTAGANVSPADLTSPTLEFTAPSQSGELQFSLVASDALLSSDPVSYSCTVNNQVPIANAGDDQIGVARNSTVTLDGSLSSDADASDTLTYLWTQIEGPSVTLDDPSSMTPSFLLLPSNLAMTFSLVVNDGETNSDADEVTIVPFNSVPSPDAVPVTVNGGEQVLLDVSNAVDSEGDQLYYQWTQVGGNKVALSHSDRAVAAFMAPLTGDPDLAFELRLSDGQSASTEVYDVTALAYTGPTLRTEGNPFIVHDDKITSQAYGAAVVEDKLYIDAANQLQVMDINDPTNPVVVTTATSGRCAALQASGTLLHCAGLDEEYSVYDISDPSATHRVGLLDLVDGDVQDVAVYGQRAYIAAGKDAGIYVVNFSDPANPVLAGGWLDSSVIMISMNRITVSADGRFLFMADNIRGLKVFDIATDPDNPQFVTILQDNAMTGNNPQEAKCDATYTYVDYKTASSACAFGVFDLSDPNNPVKLGSVEHGCFTNSRRLTIQGNRAYLAGYNSMVTGIDLSDPTNPQIMAQVSLHQGAYVAMQDNSGQTLFVVDNQSHALHLFDLISGALPVNQAQLNLGTRVSDLYAQGGVLYLSDNANLSLYDPSSSPTDWSLRGRLDRTSVTTILPWQGLVFADRSSNFESYDFRDLTQPKVLMSLNTPGTVFGAELSTDGQTAYIADSNAGLSIVDVRDPSQLSMLSSTATTKNSEFVCVEDDTVFTTTNTYNNPGLFAFDVSDPNNPTPLLDDTNSVHSQLDDVEIHDGAIFLGTWQSPLKWFDVSDPSAPVVQRYNDGIRSVSLDSFGRQLYVATMYNGLLIYDIADLSDVHWAGHFNNVGLNSTVSLDWPRAYLGDNTGVTKIDVDVVHLSNPFTTQSAGSSLTYNLSWSEPDPNYGARLQCEVSVGDCVIGNFDDVNNTAQVLWNATEAGDHEILFRVGNQQFFATARDRVTFTP